MRVKRQSDIAKTAVGRKRGIRKLIRAMGFPDSFVFNAPRQELKSIYKHLKKQYIKWYKEE